MLLKKIIKNLPIKIQKINIKELSLDSKKIKISEEEKKLFGIDKLNIKRLDIPAVTHVDYSARIQTVHKETNPKYYSLIEKFIQIKN